MRSRRFGRRGFSTEGLAEPSEGFSSGGLIGSPIRRRIQARTSRAAVPGLISTAKAGQFACHYRTFEVTDSGLPFPLSQIEEIQQARPIFTAVDLIEHFVPSSRIGLPCSAAPRPRQ